MQPQGHARVRRQLQRRASDQRRGSARQRGYDKRWEVYSRCFLRSHPACVACQNPAEVTDHIVPHKGNARLFADPANHQPMCKACHDRKTATQDGGFGRIARSAEGYTPNSGRGTARRSPDSGAYKSGAAAQARTASRGR